MVADYYRRPMLRQMLMTLIAVVALYLLTMSTQMPFLSGFFKGVSALLMSLLFYIGPLVFADENSRQLTALLPVRASEKFTVILLWCFVAVPLIIGATWTLMWCATFWADAAVSLRELYGVKGSHMLEILYPWLCALRVAQDSITVMIVLLVSLTARKGVISKGVLAAFGTMVGFGIAGTVIGLMSTMFVMSRMDGRLPVGLEEAKDEGDLFSALNTYSDGFFYAALIALGVLIVIVELLLFWRNYRIVAHRQV